MAETFSIHTWQFIYILLDVKMTSQFDESNEADKCGVYVIVLP